MTWLLEWLLGFLLNWLAGKAVSAAQQAANQLAEDKRRDEINAANVRAYEEAHDRMERIKAAESLLSGRMP